MDIDDNDYKYSMYQDIIDHPKIHDNDCLFFDHYRHLFDLHY